MADRFIVTMNGGIRLSSSTMKVVIPIIAGHLRVRRDLYVRLLTDSTTVATISLIDGKPHAVTTRHGESTPAPEWVSTLIQHLNQEFPS